MEWYFLVHISGSMRDGPLENAKSALLAALAKLSPVDSFNIIDFNVDTQLFSSSRELVTKEAKENATQWISRHFIAVGGTNILHPLNQAAQSRESSRQGQVCRESYDNIYGSETFRVLVEM